MKKKTLILLTALMMLFSVGASAQSGNGEPLKGDLNNDGKVDAADIVVLVDLVMKSGGETGGDAKYYWYAGPDMLTSETVPGTNADNECGYGWHVIEGNPTSIETGELGTSDCEKINWVLAVPTKFGLNAISNGTVDLTSVYDVTTVTCADGVEYRVFTQVNSSKKTDVIFVKGNATSETKYYWYAGPDMLTSETVPGSGTVYPMTTTDDSQIGWHVIEGNPTSIETGELISSEKINWVLAVPTKFGLNAISNSVLDVTTGYEVSTVTTADGVEYMVFKQIAASKRTDRIFVKGNATSETKYYWYAGPDMLTSETVPGTNADNECGYGWHVIEGNPTSIETGELGTSDCEKINWVLAVPTKFGLNAISNGEDITDAYDVSTVTTADGVEYMVFRQISATKKKDVVFVKGNATSETKYYWYAGLTFPTASNIVSIATGSSNSIEQWDGKEFTITNTTSSATPAYVCTPVDYKVSWKDTNGFTINLIEVENSRFTLNDVEYKVQKRGRDLSAGASFTVRGYYNSESSETKYYWYAGPDMLTSETVPGTNADNECGYGWHVIEGNPTSIETGDLGSSDCEKINWVFAVPTKFGLNALSNGEDVTDLYEVSTVTCADGVEYTVFKQIEPSKRASLAFVKGNGGASETKYYWYAGPDMLTSATVPGTNADNECGYGWHVIEGNPTSIETGELGTSDCEKINWVLAVPTKFGLNAISNGEDITDAYDVSTVTTADGVEYTVFKQISATKKKDVVFVKGN